MTDWKEKYKELEATIVAEIEATERLIHSPVDAADFLCLTASSVALNKVLSTSRAIKENKVYEEREIWLEF